MRATASGGIAWGMCKHFKRHPGDFAAALEEKAAEEGFGATAGFYSWWYFSLRSMENAR